MQEGSKVFGGRAKKLEKTLEMQKSLVPLGDSRQNQKQEFRHLT